MFMWEILCFIFTQVKPFLKKIYLPVCSFFFAIRKVYVGFHFPWALKKNNFIVSSVGRLKVSAIFSSVVVGIERFEERALSSFVPTWSNSRRWLACFVSVVFRHTSSLWETISFDYFLSVTVFQIPLTAGQGNKELFFQKLGSIAG